MRADEDDNKNKEMMTEMKKVTKMLLNLGKLQE